MEKASSRLPSAWTPSDRVVGAPVLSLTIDCPTEWFKEARIDLRITVTYDGVTGEDLKPITFHTTAVWSDFGMHSHQEGMHYYQQLDGRWEEVEFDDGEMGFAIFDAPPTSVNVGDKGRHAEYFVTLHPGESWHHDQQMQSGSYTHLPDDVKSGNKFMCRHGGATVDWWDWGTGEDHKETAVKVPCFLSGDLEEPTDNDGRPKLVLPASNEICFTYVG